MLNDELIQCPCVKVCHSETTKDGVSKFGAIGVVDSDDPFTCLFNCSGCYILENNLIPLISSAHIHHTKYPQNSLLHLMNTYGYALHLWMLGQDTSEDEGDTEDDD